MNLCPKCGGELTTVDDQYGSWWEDCYNYLDEDCTIECGYTKKLSQGHEDPNAYDPFYREEPCDRCGGGGCPKCEPRRHIW